MHFSLPLQPLVVLLDGNNGWPVGPQLRRLSNGHLDQTGESCERQTRGPVNTRSDSDCLGREVLEYIRCVVSVDPLDGMLVKFDVVDTSGNVLWGYGSDELAWGMGCVCYVSVRGIFIISYVCSHTHSYPPPSHLIWPTTHPFI